jgi:magnesium-transporting ATPase (P-type)
MQVSIHESEGRSYNLLVIKGAPEKILERCSTVYKDGKDVPISSGTNVTKLFCL